MLRRNGTANNKGYLLGAMLGCTNSNNARAVPRESKCEHATPLVPLEQSANETKCGHKCGRKCGHVCVCYCMQCCC